MAVDRTSARSAGDSGVALPVALGVMLFVGAISILLLGLILAQATPVTTTQAASRALGAAQAGIDAGMAAIRSSGEWEYTVGNPLDGTYVGNYTELPCQDIVGNAGTDGSGTYSVRFAYVDAGDNPITSCPLASRPVRVDLVSQGSVSSGGDDVVRQVEAGYTFLSGDAATGVPGGRIHNFQDGSALDLCFDAGESPVSGTVVLVQACEGVEADRTTIPDRQKWSYRTDYSIVLASSETEVPFSGLCIDADVTVGSAATLRTCDGTGSQKWNFNDNAAFQGELEDAFGAPATMAGYCLYGPNTAGATLKTSTSGCWGPYNRYSTWDPEPSVGAGNAGKQFNQLVNYLEFGRCFDVTHWVVDEPFMIAFPCKQDASVSGAPGWNQRPTYFPTSPTDAPLAYGQLRVGPDVATGGNCLTAPMAGTNPPYVRVNMACSDTEPRQRWVVYGRFSASGVGEDKLVSYTVRLYETGASPTRPPTKCLSLGPPGAASGELSQWSTITLEPCATSLRDVTLLEQKWNAPPAFLDQVMGEVREVPVAP